MYPRLVAYEKQCNTIIVPAKYKDDPKLGKWVAHQLTALKKLLRMNIINFWIQSTLIGGMEIGIRLICINDLLRKKINTILLMFRPENTKKIVNLVSGFLLNVLLITTKHLRRNFVNF